MLGVLGVEGVICEMMKEERVILKLKNKEMIKRRRGSPRIEQGLLQRFITEEIH